MALNPSPQRQTAVTFPTPNVNDILFFETVDAERVGTDVPEYGTKHPDMMKWPDHRLVFIESGDSEGQNRYYRYYYAADQTGQDDDNWSHTEADIGGTKFDAVARDYVIRRSEYDPDTPAMGSPMPDVPESKFGNIYVLAQRKQTPLNDKVLSGLYVVEQRVYIRRTTITRLDYDEFFQTTNYTKQTLYYKGEIPTGVTDPIETLVDDPTNSYWGLSGSGILKTAAQLSDNWYAVTEQQVVNTTAGGGMLSYKTVENSGWPAVLADGEGDSEEPIDSHVWEKRDGGSKTYPKINYKRGAYNGPTEVLYTITWSRNIPSVSPTTRPLPDRITITTPFFSFGTENCLHKSIYYTVAVGNTDPTFETAQVQYDFPATNMTDWEDYVGASSVKPFRGGWLKTDVTYIAPID